MSDVMPSRSGRKAKGEGHERRAEILAAAERIFVEHGYEGATIRKIADEVGLSSTALYLHFPDKGAILHEICLNALARLTEATRTIVDGDQGADKAERLRRSLAAYVEFGFENPNAYRLLYMTRPSEAREGAQAAAQEQGASLFQSFEDQVEALAQDGRLASDGKVTAQALWAGVHGVVSLMIAKPYFDWVDRRTLSEAMLDGLFRGLIR